MTDWTDTDSPGEVLLGASTEPESSARPNLLLLGAGAAAALAALLLFGGIVLNLLGYAIASIGVFTLVAFFRRASVRRSAELGISPPRNLNLAAFGLVAIGFVLSVVHAWLIATYLS